VSLWGTGRDKSVLESGSKFSLSTAKDVFMLSICRKKKIRVFGWLLLMDLMCATF
jgi:hypothetical protein